jgi:hypothetical protein
MDWWAAAPPRALTILDGDRLSHAGAVSFFAEQPGARLVCCYLTAPIAVGASRRAARGSNQNAAWVKGRATKACRFYANFPGHKLELPAAGDPHDLAIAVLRAVFER